MAPDPDPPDAVGGGGNTRSDLHPAGAGSASVGPSPHNPAMLSKDQRTLTGRLAHDEIHGPTAPLMGRLELDGRGEDQPARLSRGVRDDCQIPQKS